MPRSTNRSVTPSTAVEYAAGCRSTCTAARTSVLSIGVLVYQVFYITWLHAVRGQRPRHHSGGRRVGVAWARTMKWLYVSDLSDRIYLIDQIRSLFRDLYVSGRMRSRCIYIRTSCIIYTARFPGEICTIQLLRNTFLPGGCMCDAALGTIPHHGSYRI